MEGFKVTWLKVFSVTWLVSSLIIAQANAQELTKLTKRDGDKKPSASQSIAMLIDCDNVDIDGDDHVGATDLVAVLLAWHTDDAAADVDDSGYVDVTDLQAVIYCYGHDIEPPVVECSTSSPMFFNTALDTAQQGLFTARYTATPLGGSIDALTALSQGQGSNFDEFAILVRFNQQGHIDVRNGDLYEHDLVEPLNYVAFNGYDFRIEADVQAHTYSVFVTPPNGNEIALATNYAFRTSQNEITEINNMATYAGLGIHQVCGFEIEAAESSCGNGIIEGEACDDGNTSNGDGCNQDCSMESGYVCSGAPSFCEPDSDGDGVPNSSDNCDFTYNPGQENSDGTNDGGDVCDSDDDNDGIPDSQEEPGCALNPDPECGNTQPECGNGVLNGEACDDGNTSNGDGCSQNCSIEPGYVCSGEPSFCLPDSDGDGVPNSSDNCDFVYNPGQENTDGANDGGDACDSDDDNDGVNDGQDSNPLNPNLCGDADSDSCEDCASGTSNPGNDGTDTDGDGSCNAGDPDDDGDGIADSQEEPGCALDPDPDCGDDVVPPIGGCLPYTSECLEHHTIDSNPPSNKLWSKMNGDIDGDGRSDPIVAGGSSGLGVYWYKYVNAGSWQKHQAAGSNPTSGDWNGGTTGDVDGDGDIDIVAGVWNSGGGLYWIENPLVNSSGGSGNPTVLSQWQTHTIDEGISADSMYVRDVNNDGSAEVLYRSSSTWGGSSPDKVYIFTFQGNPDNQSSWIEYSISGTHGEEHFNVGHINDDQYIDVVVGDRWYENPGSSLQNDWQEHLFANSWINEGAGGTWQRNATFPFVADINGDGRNDVVLAPTEKQQDSVTHKIAWYEAPANPEQSNWVEHCVENNVDTAYHSLDVRDFDLDGDLDISTAEMHQTPGDEVKIYRNENNGETGACSGSGNNWPKILLLDGNGNKKGSHYLQAFDADGDGDLDLFGANHHGGSGVDFWENKAADELLLPIDDWNLGAYFDRSNRGSLVTSADLNGDNQPDLLVGDSWYENTGSISSSWTQHTFGGGLDDMGLAYDFDNDGDMDVFGATGIPSAAGPSTLKLARNDGQGNFTVHNIGSSAGDFFQGIVAAKFQGASGPVQVVVSWHNSGNTSDNIEAFTVPSNLAQNPSQNWPMENLLVGGSLHEGLDAGDMDSDGDLDLLFGRQWLENLGGGSFSSPHTLTSSSGLADRSVLADIDGDGKLDAVLGYEAINILGKLAWYKQPNSNQTNTWSEVIIANGSGGDLYGPQSVDVADMDYDGDLDIIVGEHKFNSSAELFIYENKNGAGTQWERITVYTGHEHHDGAQVFDMDGDFDMDIVSVAWQSKDAAIYENKSIP